MHAIWKIPTVNMIYTRSQNYTNMMVDKHEIQSFEVVIIALLFLLSSFDVLVPAHRLLFRTKLVCPSIPKCEFLSTSDCNVKKHHMFKSRKFT